MEKHFLKDRPRQQYGRNNIPRKVSGPYPWERQPVFLFMRPGRRVKCEFYSENWGFLPPCTSKIVRGL